MAVRPTALEIFTSTHHITGHIHPGPLGLFAFVNRPTESSLEIEAVHIHALHQLPEEAETLPSLWMVKAEIAVIAVGSRMEIGSTGGARGGYTKPFPHRVRVLLTGYELQGLIESAGKLDFSGLILEGERLFVAAYESQLRAVLFPRVQLAAGGVLFNRRMVQAISLQRASA
jgi:hypothetical protein